MKSTQGLHNEGHELIAVGFSDDGVLDDFPDRFAVKAVGSNKETMRGSCLARGARWVNNGNVRQYSAECALVYYDSVRFSDMRASISVIHSPFKPSLFLTFAQRYASWWLQRS